VYNPVRHDINPKHINDGNNSPSILLLLLVWNDVDMISRVNPNPPVVNATVINGAGPYLSIAAPINGVKIIDINMAVNWTFSNIEVCSGHGDVDSLVALDVLLSLLLQ